MSLVLAYVKYENVLKLEARTFLKIFCVFAVTRAFLK